MFKMDKDNFNGLYVEKVYVSSHKIYYIQVFRNGSVFRFSKNLNNYISTHKKGNYYNGNLDHIFGCLKKSQGKSNNISINLPKKNTIHFTRLFF